MVDAFQVEESPPRMSQIEESLRVMLQEENQQGAEITDRVSVPFTTVMVRNLPRKFVAEDLLTEIAAVVPIQEVDFVSLPWDRKAPFNLGWSCVNFTSHDAASKVLKSLDGHAWARVKTVKIGKVLEADIQGLVPNIFHSIRAMPEDIRKQHHPRVVIDGLQVDWNTVARIAREVAPSKCITNAGSVKTRNTSSRNQEPGPDSSAPANAAGSTAPVIENSNNNASSSQQTTADGGSSSSTSRSEQRAQLLQQVKALRQQCSQLEWEVEQHFQSRRRQAQHQQQQQLLQQKLSSWQQHPQFSSMAGAAEEVGNGGVAGIEVVGGGAEAGSGSASASNHYTTNSSSSSGAHKSHNQGQSQSRSGSKAHPTTTNAKHDTPWLQAREMTGNNSHSSASIGKVGTGNISSSSTGHRKKYSASSSLNSAKAATQGAHADVVSIPSKESKRLHPPARKDASFQMPPQNLPENSEASAGGGNSKSANKNSSNSSRRKIRSELPPSKATQQQQQQQQQASVEGVSGGSSSTGSQENCSGGLNGKSSSNINGNSNSNSNSNNSSSFGSTLASHSQHHHPSNFQQHKQSQIRQPQQQSQTTAAKAKLPCSARTAKNVDSSAVASKSDESSTSSGPVVRQRVPNDPDAFSSSSLWSDISVRSEASLPCHTGMQNGASNN
mmetsp:Transcript_32890/g.70774  ORF Transcript_32890/g.70774 Transcript_32890/m.70774 type:complete len:667 (-) Transcript_32890:886-2886(-)